ncbi:MAG: GNAT family N-acetyltransferase [Arenicellales bacterium]|nr:GNAT family N-acetyltransferase [Arenicellales bacterium]
MTYIRSAVLADADKLTEIAHTAKQHWGYPDAWIELWQKDLTVTPQYIDENTIYVAECDHHVAGFVSLDMQDNEAEIDHLWVLPEYMGLGIGRQLVYCALDHCKSRGVERLKVVSDPNATDFYRRMGAVQQGQVASTPAPRKLPLLQFDVNQHPTNQ